MSRVHRRINMRVEAPPWKAPHMQAWPFLGKLVSHALWASYWDQDGSWHWEIAIGSLERSSGG
eukprot:4858975-Pyramimonas_sp.AAC.1